MSKTPFEIRADILKQAQDLLESQYDANVKFASEAFFKLVKDGSSSMEALEDFMPKFPTAEDVMKQAREFYSFVSSK